jgi:hypothetical protein
MSSTDDLYTIPLSKYPLIRMNVILAIADFALIEDFFVKQEKHYAYPGKETSYAN